MLFKQLGISALVIGTCSLSAFALTIDGNLSDWGVTVADNNGSHFNSWASNIGLLDSMVEDQDDHAGLSAYLGPNQGGQDFDAEMMAVALQGHSLYIAIVTGQRPDNGFKYFEPGDIRIETDGGRYGIEVGGGKGGESGQAIVTGAPGATYQLQSNGEAKNYLNAELRQTAGSIWKDVEWLLDPIDPKGPTQFAVNANSQSVGVANYTFTRNSVTTQHAIMELEFDASLLGSTVIQGIYWRPACGNDELDVAMNHEVPEPATLLFLALGSLAFLVRRSRW